MAEEFNESKMATVTLDGKTITLEQLEEAKQNKSVRIIEDKNNPGSYKTLKKMYS